MWTPSRDILTAQDRLARSGHERDDVGIARGVGDRVSRPQRCGRVRLHVFDQFFDVSARRTPHANLGEIPDALNGFDVALRLDARADDSEHARILARQVPRRRRRHRRRSRLGDVAAVQNRQECSSQRLEEHDGRQMRWQSLRRVGSVDRYQLGAERLRVADVCRHDADEPVLRPDFA